jgi:hypothetical protein
MNRYACWNIHTCKYRPLLQRSFCLYTYKVDSEVSVKWPGEVVSGKHLPGMHETLISIPK